MSDHALSRRSFMQTSVAAVAGSALLSNQNAVALAPQKGVERAKGELPVIVSSMNGFRRPKSGGVSCVEEAMAQIKNGRDPLDAAIAGVNIVEDDPDDNSVGLGGLPNEDGVVELDSSVMHGPTHKAGAVAALRNIKNPSRVAKLVMTRTDHVLIVGEGALRFARAHGFKEEDLLTDVAREEWLKWKENHSENDDWVSPSAATSQHSAAVRSWMHTYGTINCCAVDTKGDIGGVTTTSGLSYKIPGRVGDSPIIGAGLYVDNEVGAAGSTGRGEANLQNCSSFLVVELMRDRPAKDGLPAIKGMHPTDACVEVLRRIIHHSEPRLKDEKGLPKFDLKLYAVAKDGRYGSASIWSGAKFAVNDAKGGPRLEECEWLYESGRGGAD